MPKPKETDWELELPEEQQESFGAELTVEEDAADRDRRTLETRRAAERAHFRKQTQVIQRALPRPSVVEIGSLLKNARQVSDPYERLIAEEMALLVSRDAVMYPVSGAKVNGTLGPADAVEEFSEDALNRARMEIVLERPDESVAKANLDFQDAWEKVHDPKKLPGLGGYGEDEVDEHQLMTEVFDVGFKWLQVNVLVRT